MDGNTTVITRAGDMAVGRGIVVVNSAGNNGYNPSHNTLNAPADGDSVLAVGAVTSSGTISGFSSGGPTTSVPPRIKPDILAQGSSVRCASSSNPTGYSYASGTSLSCPLSAGVAALIVKARPNATPVQIANAMRLTASRAGNPDNQYGWGIIDAVAAINQLNPNGTGGHDTKPTAYILEQNYPNPFNPATTIRYGVPEPAWVTLRIYDVLGHEVRVLVDAQQSATTHTTAWDGTDSHGNPVASGVYIYRLSAAGSLGYYNLSKKLVVLR
jgi:subtilisin family serine protease